MASGTELPFVWSLDNRIACDRRGNESAGAQFAVRARFTSGGVASSTSAASASSVGITFCPSLPSRRIEIEWLSASFLPTTSRAGIFASECSRTL